MPTARVQTRATSTKLHTLCSLLSLLLLASTVAASASSSSTSTNLFKRLRGSQIAPGVSPAGDDYWCRVEGECLPCPPGARNSDVCKIYGNRRPLICVPRHASTNSHSGPVSPVVSAEAFDNQDTDSDSDEGDNGAAKEKNTNVSEKPKSKPKPLVEPAGSQAEADDLARQDEETFRNAAAAGLQDDDDDKEGGSKAGLSKADQELQDELQAERRRRQRQRRRRARARGGGGGGLAESASSAGRRQGPISTWEACPKVLHSEHHDYFEFILCNAGFAAVAIAVLVFRQRTLALQQFARLAARIMQTQAV